MPAPGLLVSLQPRVKVAGQLARFAANAVLQLSATESEAGLATLELQLLNWRTESDDGAAGYAFEDEADLALGSDIEVLVGDDPGVRLFQGRVTALEGVFDDAGPPQLLVLAEDAAAALRLRRSSARHEGVSASDVVRRIAADHGLTAQVSGDFGPVTDWLQLGETDLGFVRRLCARHGRRLRLDGRTLAVDDGLQPDPDDPPLRLDHRADLKDARVLADLAHQCTAVRVTGFDIASGQKITETATTPSGLPGQGRSGPQVLRQTFGERIEPMHHHPGWTAAEAAALAQQALDDRARRFLRLRAVALDQPAMRCGADLEVTGLGPRFSGRYVVTRVDHRFDRALGFRSEFEAFGAFLGEAA